MILTATGLTMDPSMMEEVLHRGGGGTGGGVTAGHHAKYDYERHDNTQITFRMPHFQVSFNRYTYAVLAFPIFRTTKTSAFAKDVLDGVQGRLCA